MTTELVFSADENYLTIRGHDKFGGFYTARYNENNDCSGCAFTGGYHGCKMPELSPMIQDNQRGKTKCNGAYGRIDGMPIVWKLVDGIPESTIKSMQGFNGFVIYDVVRKEFRDDNIYENVTDVISVIETDPNRENLVVYELGKKYELKTKIELVEV